MPIPCAALEPHQILVIANKNAAGSVELARFYMSVRDIPKTHLLQLSVTNNEWCSRDEYEKKVANKVRKHLMEKDPLWQIRCLVTMYGLPLKVRPPEMTPEEKKQVETLKRKQKIIKERLQNSEEQKEEGIDALREESKTIENRILTLTRKNQRSSLDSELALVLKEDYSLIGGIPNPYFIGYKDKKLPIQKEKILMVSRLDGPSEKTVRRIIQDSLEAEKNGLTGTAYFDARWPRPQKKKLSGYALYDDSIHKAADQVRKSHLLPVVVNDVDALFQPGESPDAALYCGWYSLAKYVDAFTWRPGAVGYHIASSECSTLKNKNSRVWCKMMLEKGVAATIGPVSEPYVQAFAVPEVFFGLLVEGKTSLVECYFLSLPFLSWQMVLVGDPLYRPFKSLKRQF